MNRLKRLYHSSARELDVLAAYAEWSPNYPAHAHNPLMRAEERAMLGLLPEVRGKIVLDLACGTGRYARILHEHGANRIVGADISPEMLARANKSDASFVLAKLTQLPMPNSSYDVTICALAIGHVAELGHALAEISRVLKTGGILLYSDLHPLGYLAGWRREFNGRDGKRYAVKHHAHLYSDHDAACRSAGMLINAIREPIIGRDITEKFSGSDEIYRKWNGWPALLVIRAEKV